MLVHAKAARAGVYDYLGVEVDPTGAKFKATDTVKVYRPAEEVFAKASLASFVLRPITDDHPTVAVNSSNWRDHAGGSIVGAVKDGDHVGFDLAFMDATTVAKVDNGKVELSAGYTCDLAIEDGIAPDGTAYQAVQRNIRGNHVALVARGRAGPDCRVIADAAACDALSSLPKLNNDGDRPVKTMLIDGLTVDYSNPDTAKATLDTLIAARDAASKIVTDHVATIAAKDRELATKDGEIATLKAKVEDEATLDARADAKAELVTRGKALLGDAMPDVKGKSLSDTRRAIVLAVTKDASLSGKSDDYIEARFDNLAAKDATTVHPLIAPTVIGDAATREATAYSKANDHNSWRTAGKAA